MPPLRAESSWTASHDPVKKRGRRWRPLEAKRSGEARYAVPTGSLEAGSGVVVAVYSNSSSAPNSASRTFLRRPSLRARARPAPTSPMRSTRPRRRFFLLPRKESAASRSEVAASRSSFCVFLSSVSDRTGPLPLDMRAYAFLADSNAVFRLSRRSSSSISRWTYWFVRTAWPAATAPAPAFAAFFLAAISLLGSVAARTPYPERAVFLSALAVSGDRLAAG